MPRRKQLKNLACGIASRFASRNNDIDGYWALGLLYATAESASTNIVRLDLVSETASPSFKHSARLLSQHSQYMQEQLAKFDLEGSVFAAAINIEFNVEPLPCDILRKSTWGDPFSCRVTLADDLGREHVGTFRGWCSQHDARKEHRSSREYAT